MNQEEKAKQVLEAQQGAPQQMQVTPEMIKNSQNLKCDDCGGMLFTEKLMFKTISPILSPSGRMETIPMPVIVCDKCGKVPSIFDPQNLVPKELKTNQVINQPAPGKPVMQVKK